MIRFYLALFLGKLSRITIKLLHRFLKTQGSDFPGKLAMQICPDFLQYVGKPETVIAITGTNGKTTSTNLLSDILEDCGYSVLSNRYGSNTKTCIATCLLCGVSLRNRPRKDAAVLEVDERSSLLIYPYVQPDWLICTNLTRDTITRNAHPYFIFDVINQAVPDKTVLVLNADDNISSRLKPENRHFFYAIGMQEDDRREPFNLVNDMRVCPHCLSPLQYRYVRYNHIGNAFCPVCGFHSPEPDFLIEKIDRRHGLMTAVFDGQEEAYPLLSNTIFNIYDETAIVAFLRRFGIPYKKVRDSLVSKHIVDSRLSVQKNGDISLISIMAKGGLPTSMSVVFDTIRSYPGSKEAVLMLEDCHVMAHSIENLCYLYDADFEFLTDPSITRLVIVGPHADDYRLRLLMAGMPEEKMHCLPDYAQIPAALERKKNQTIFFVYDLYYANLVKQIGDAILHQDTQEA